MVFFVNSNVNMVVRVFAFRRQVRIVRFHVVFVLFFAWI